MHQSSLITTFSWEDSNTSERRESFLEERGAGGYEYMISNCLRSS